jgi:hypothetical protein
MIRRAAGLVLMAGACLVPPVAAQPAPQAAADPWYGRIPKTKNFEARLFPGAMTIEVPRDWQVLPGHGSTLFAAAEKVKKDQPPAGIVLEYTRLPAAFDPKIASFVGTAELSDVRETEPDGRDFTQQVKTAAEIGPYIFIEYNRPGLAGADDHVVQYSMFSGRVRYRLICIAPAVSVDKYRPTFAHIAASVKLSPPPGTPQP